MNDLKTASFYDATKDVFKTMLDVDISQLQTVGDAGNEETLEVSIGVVGDLAGRVCFRFPKSTVLNIVKTLSGMETDALDDFASSVVGEITNIISGNAVTSLSACQIVCDIKPPQITVRSGENGSAPEPSLSLLSQAGSLNERIDLSEKP